MAWRIILKIDEFLVGDSRIVRKSNQRRASWKSVLKGRRPKTPKRRSAIQEVMKGLLIKKSMILVDCRTEILRRALVASKVGRRWNFGDEEPYRHIAVSGHPGDKGLRLSPLFPFPSAGQAGSVPSLADGTAGYCMSPAPVAIHLWCIATPFPSGHGPWNPRTPGWQVCSSISYT